MPFWHLVTEFIGFVAITIGVILLAPNRTRLVDCAAKEAQALRAAGQLTPFYADQLKTPLGVS